MATYRRPVPDILSEICSTITYPVVIKSVVVGAAIQTLTCDDIIHAQAGYNIVLAEGTFTIESIDFTNNKIVVTGATPLIAAQTFNLYKPFFYHGTEPETAKTLINTPNHLAKTPMIWMRENYTEDVRPKESSLSRIADVELYFLTTANYKKVIGDRYTEYVRPMMRLLEYWYKQAEKLTTLVDLEGVEYGTETFTMFGAYARGKGISENLFVDTLAGQGMKIQLPIVKKSGC